MTEPAIQPTGATPARSPRAMALGPLLIVLAIFTVGVVLVAMAHWRRGGFVMGAACVAAAIARLVLPTSTVGLLAVRSRAVDVTVCLVLGVGLMALAAVVPGVFL